MRLAVLAALALSCSGACALTSKAEPVDIRWYTVERPRVELTAQGAERAPSGPPIELGRVTSGTHLRERIVYRDSAHRIGFYEERRWTERPETYLRRELERTLYEERGFRRALVGAPVLEVELIEFEEVRATTPHLARIRLRMVVRDGATVIGERTLTAERPFDPDAPGGAALAAAMADAMDEITDAVARRAALALAELRQRRDDGTP